VLSGHINGQIWCCQGMSVDRSDVVRACQWAELISYVQ
jgi:hypothetical protein